MDGSVGSGGDERVVFGEFAHDGVELTGFEDLAGGEWWEDGLEGFGEHGFATTRCSDHENIVEACSCYHECTLGCELTLDMAEITEMLGVLCDGFANTMLMSGSECGLSMDAPVYNLLEMLNGVVGDIGEICKLKRVFCWDKEAGISLLYRRHDHGEKSGYFLDITSQSQFTKP